MQSPTSKKIKNSILYKIELGDKVDLRKKVTTKLSKNYAYLDVTLPNSLPLPRDGHTTAIYNDKLIIFGGDRNKFPFNDFYFFKIK